VGSFHNFIAKILVDIVWSRVSGDTNQLDTSRDDPINDCLVEHSSIQWWSSNLTVVGAAPGMSSFFALNSLNCSRSIVKKRGVACRSGTRRVDRDVWRGQRGRRSCSERRNVLIVHSTSLYVFTYRNKFINPSRSRVEGVRIRRWIGRCNLPARLVVLVNRFRKVTDT